MDTDTFNLSFITGEQGLVGFLQQNKDDFDCSELDQNYILYSTSNGIRYRKIENRN